MPERGQRGILPRPNGRSDTPRGGTQMSARRKEKRYRVFRAPVGQRMADVMLLVLVVPVAAAAAALLVVAGATGAAARFGVELGGSGAMGVAGAVVVLVLVFRFWGWLAWTLELEEDAAVL